MATNHNPKQPSTEEWLAQKGLRFAGGCKAPMPSAGKRECELAMAYEQGLLGVLDKDERKAVELYIKAAEQGNAVAQVNLAWCYQEGSGVDKDDRKAVEWLIKAANQRCIEGMNNLGSLYEKGVPGVLAKDEKHAFSLYLLAAYQGHGSAFYNMGRCYEHGIGVDKQFFKAADCFNQAAKNGVDGASECAARCMLLALHI